MSGHAPDEAIENLRLERYADGHCSSKILRTVYYLFRPLTTLSVRKQIQRFHAGNWRTFSCEWKDVWSLSGS